MSNNRRHLANAIRVLSMDAVQKANSGHPGAPMGMADIAEVLWNSYMKHNPTNPGWADRDRFILSNGHGSMLIYSLLHLTGYDLPMDEIKRFRQLHSRTPGHPEYGYAPGVETTTGPLGQGITNGVGMALAEKTLAAQFNRPGHSIVDHFTYVFLGDGCLMEGISHEACSLAGTLGLGKLVAFWDDNGISIDGHVEGWFSDDTPGRFESYGWQVIRDVNGHDADEIKAAIDTARANTDQPTMICCKTIIGFGSPNKSGSHDCHGAALGDAECALVRKELNWNYEPFVIPEDVYAGWDAKEKGAVAESDWDSRFAAYAEAHPELAAELKRRLNNELAADWEEKANAFIAEVNAKAETIASRKASQNSIEGFAKFMPEFLGGSADLAGSNLTLWSGSKPVCEHTDGNYVNYGVREFGMTAIINGVALHGGFVPYGATFLMFSEYARNALRMAALMKVRNIEVYTHDSIGLGEDGPTHQPVEQTATLRMIPNMDVWRPCDAVESAVCWKVAIKNQTGPSSLIFSRQNLPHMDRTADQIKQIERGGYILRDCEGTPDVIIIATGSEVSLAVDAAAASDKKVRVVSMPSTNTYDQQDAAYKESVLPSSVTARVSVEAGVTGFWAKYIGLNGKAIGMDTFGESAPAGELFKEFGITTEAVVAAINEVA
ncbi:MAG: transketolase [Zetaproteobacteria bacterium CG_4_9_14_3_um_filter_49_83]|nr:MAG: transketolase [Zetaproteobacteria bacterium CG1_02_49_23]PIQ34295.1 MAG: transketolase [Zetaproteobacteria bacterium CG17_big_fil_post_rev_8_21_14_2_50_50_13]PIV29731.1 MAG: transketolase [Zetaproteobacteria bacterium CG02_land_8_20_14_3_00_50_9]PIY57205.1 MAG: transketolase [Zetaproteobacteria bacterium CG_4_10_14_0_8_um_filter_49_80]PJA35416.1 MAG: transketolase [Zetaproteobacteria bacterium CG_4_9_14_3_um_filter_49_83]